MKKTIAFLALLLTTLSASAQFYVSLSGGRAFGTNEQVLGEKTTTFNDGSNTFSTDLKGSYGDGITGQLRLGYFFNETIGIELGAGYLHGYLQNISQGVATSVDASSTVTTVETSDRWGRGRAFGASLSAVANITKNVYVRAGLLTKIGGKTEVTSYLDLTSLGLGENQIVTDFNGKLPLGFIGAAGYKFKLTEHLSLFAEIEYMNINVKRDTSTFSEFNNSLGIDRATAEAAVTGAFQQLAAAGLTEQATELGGLLILLDEDTVQWGENGLPAPKSPYSSLGGNIGVTYSF